MIKILDFLFNFFKYIRNIFEAFVVTIFLSKVYFFESFWIFLIISFWFYNYDTEGRQLLTQIALIHYSIVFKSWCMVCVWLLYFLIFSYPILYVQYYKKKIDTEK